MSEVIWRRADGPTVSEARIVELERALGVQLPKALLEIVRLGDGLRPERETIVERRLDGIHVVDALCGILRFENDEILQSRDALVDDQINRRLELLMEQNANCDIRALTQAVEDETAELRWVIPVADNGDGWICLDYRGDPDRMSHKVVGYSLTPVDEADKDGLHPIADDFEALLAMLSE